MNRDFWLWAGILTGPVAFLTSFLANFVLAPLACGWHWKPALFVVSLTALALSGGSGVVAWRQWSRLGREVPGDTDGDLPRARIMAIAGVALSTLFCIVIFAQGTVEGILGACE